jgi:hypothetical protein
LTRDPSAEAEDEDGHEREALLLRLHSTETHKWPRYLWDAWRNLTVDTYSRQLAVEQARREADSLEEEGRRADALRRLSEQAGHTKPW